MRSLEARARRFPGVHWQLPAGLVGLMAGAMLSLTPRYIPQDPGPAAYAGTWWFVGAPIAVVGALLLAWDLQLRRPGL